ncbi:hypothetical protein K461DRAFT_317168 [Myriangium duriaei CBS 260.36]|uniref:Uncharacterized protein n=1 Tax=Myriangium duriaei CBS 260.36 TaxID=1168546 RepID=A0A9P4JC92_9PEZI|nr:hypothetical protein K461DRAFT_317168 [Myriangium duriaei CBS 260.36]
MSTWDPTTGPLHMPHQAVPAAVGIILVSFISLVGGLILIYHLSQNEGRYTYVSLFTFSSTVMTAVAIMQEFNYLTRWRSEQVNTWRTAVRAVEHPYLAVGPQSKGFAPVLYWIQIFLSLSSALLVTFWAMALAIKAWDWRFGRLYNYRDHFSIFSKVVAFLAPALTALFRATIHLEASMSARIFLSYIVLFFSFTAGAISVFLVLFKYVATRLDFRRIRSGFTTNLTTFRKPAGNATSAKTAPTRKPFLIDSWLVWRFSIACLIFCGFNAYLIWYSTRSYKAVLLRGTRNSPDFSVQATLNVWFSYVPLFTPSLLAFMLFGTTSLALAHYRTVWHRLFSEQQDASAMQSSRDLLNSVKALSDAGLEKGRETSITVQTVDLQKESYV